MKAISSDRKTLILIPSAFLASIGIGMVNFAMLFVVKESFHAGARSVGWFMALWSVAYLSGCILLKRPAVNLGPRLSMTISSFGSVFVLGLFFLFPSLGSAFLAYSAYGFLCALFWPPLMAWLSAGLEGSALGKATSTFSLSWSSGGIIAPYLSGFLAERSLEMPVYLGMAIFLATGFLVLSSSRLAPTPPKKTDASRAAEAEDRSTPLRFPAWIGAFLIYAVMAVFFNIFPVFAKDELRLSESRIGFLLLLRALFAASGFWALGRFEFWHFRKRYIFLGTGLLLVLDIAFIPLRSPLAFGIGLCALGLVQSLCYNNSIFYGVSGARDRSRRMTMHESILTAGQILGSIGGGIVYQAFSWPSVFLLLAGLIGIGIVMQAILVRRKS